MNQKSNEPSLDSLSPTITPASIHVPNFVDTLLEKIKELESKLEKSLVLESIVPPTPTPTPSPPSPSHSIPVIKSTSTPEVVVTIL